MNPMNPSLIDDQVETLGELYGAELPKLLTDAKAAALPRGIKRVYALGNGDSHHAALAAAQAFSQWAGVEYLPMPAYTFSAAEIARLDRERADETLVACISASGSSKLAVGILTAVRERGLGHTLSITGRSGCAMDECAQWVLPAGVSEKGRSPGIRTYAASLSALMALACRLGGHEDQIEELSKQLATSAQRFPQIISEARQLAVSACRWEWPLAVLVGCDGLLGCAQFIAAKFAEGCGVFAAAQEMEEWCHVESMTYPLNSPVIILQGARATSAQAKKVAQTAGRAGRPVLILDIGGDVTLEKAGELYLGMHIACDEALYPFYHYIPGVILVRALADKLSRAMFLSDLPISLF